MRKVFAVKTKFAAKAHKGHGLHAGELPELQLRMYSRTHRDEEHQLRTMCGISQDGEFLFLCEVPSPQKGSDQCPVEPSSTESSIGTESLA